MSNVCANCGAEIPDGAGGHADGIGFVCCVHCVFNPPPDLVELEQDDE